MKIPFFQPAIDHLEEEALIETLRSGWISTGPRCVELEVAFAEAHGAAHAVAVSNGTAALHLAFLVHDIGPGDEVIVPSLSFCATASSAVMAGATPVFAEVTSLEDWTLSPQAVERALTPQTRAIVPMHYAGYGCDLEALRSLADEHGLALIEDACHAPLGERSGTRLGAASDAACYSFYSNKNLTTAEGGMILFRDEGRAARAKRLRSHGMTTSVYDREKGRRGYDVPEMGYNYRMDDLRAAMGLVQLRKLPGEIAGRARAASLYRELLSGQEAFVMPFAGYEGRPSHHLLPVLATDEPTRDAAAERLASTGIGSSVHYRPIHTFAPFRDFARTPLPLTESIGSRELSLPLFGSITEEQVRRVVGVLLG